jgi:alpha-tubulin suppressor-like RCC1 family protein
MSGITNASSVAGGDSFSLKAKADGTLWACGYNGYGQLGDGTTEQRMTPVKVTNVANVTSIACGWSFSLALVVSSIFRTF